MFSQITIMSNGNKFSPFYKVKVILLPLQWLIEFTLRRINDDLGEFLFKPCGEYIRYSINVCIFCKCQSCMFSNDIKWQHVKSI